MKNNYKIVIIDDDELAVDNLAFELKSCRIWYFSMSSFPICRDPNY